ncbi:hypothetical protein [Sphaerisporangium krabiense]|uniref:Uncharacterized protein n=1 Tax=Sphaerisporangium krabiense TaxID=763782 RepID=A0A7W8Z6I6_9ACTN|nr:hypothetical protein [Sphaerisporangium krabiense]MBB5628292.1 hypothetical protein [Sphaerisporangium krabiense]
MKPRPGPPRRPVPWAARHGHMAGQRVLARGDAFTAARDLSVNVTLGGTPVTPDGTAAARRTEAAREGTHRRERPLFVQYLNPEILACYGRDAAGRDAEAAMRQALDATRLAVLLTDSYLLFPSSSMFELPWFGVFLGNLTPLVHEGLVRHTSTTPELSAYRERKAREYRGDRGNAYARAGPLRVAPDLAWYPRFGDPTATGIAEMWKRAVTPDGDLSGLVRTLARAWGRPYDQVAAVMAASPDRLDGQAFVRRFVERTLPAPVPDQARGRLAQFVSAAYLRCYVRDLDASLLTDLPLAPLSCGLDETEDGLRGRVLSYRRLDLALRWLRVDEFVHDGATWRELVLLRSRPEFGVITSTLYGSGSADAVRCAVVRAGAGLDPALTCGQAVSNVAAVAERLARAPG